MFIRQNATQEFIGDMRDASQPTISRYVTKLVPIVKAVLEEFVPSAEDAIEMVKGRVVLVDGTLTPCSSYEEHQELWNKKHKTTGFNAQLISLLDGTAAWISGPLPGKTHDAKAYKETGAAAIVKESGGGFGDKGYQGTGLVTSKKKPKGGELTLSDKDYNSQIASFRAPVERLVAHFKNQVIPNNGSGSLLPWFGWPNQSGVDDDDFLPVLLCPLADIPVTMAGKPIDLRHDNAVIPCNKRGITKPFTGVLPIERRNSTGNVIGYHLDYVVTVVRCPLPVIFVLRVDTRLTVAILRQSSESY